MRIGLFETATVKGPEIEIREYPGKCRAIQGAPNILVVAHHASEYLFGSERSFLDILEGFKGLPANLFVALPRNVPDYTNAIRLYASKVFVFKYGWWKKNEKPILAVQRAFEKIITENGIHAVHSNTIMLRECLSAAKNRKIPGIVHVRELIRDDRALLDVIGQSADAIIAKVIRQAAWIVGNSKATADAFNKPNRTFVVPNTIDVASLDIANEIRDGVVWFGLISSNITKKGLMDVVELARLAARAGSKARFLLIGPETELVQRIRKMQLDGAVPANLSFSGYAKTPKDAIGQVNVVLNFSHFAESFGRTVLEAMAARRPVIAYQWGALPELIDHGETGFLVPFKKPASALQYVEELCANPKLIQLLGSKGRDVAVAKYSTAQYSLALKRAYTSILARAHAELFGSLVRPPLPSRISPGPVVHQARSQNAIAKSSQAPRVAYFCWHFPVPSETFVLNELEVLVNLGLDVIVFCRQSPHKHFTPSFAINYERVDSPQMLARRLQETSRTIVHAHFTYPTVTDMVWPACEIAKIPFTFIAHAQDIFRYDNDRRNRLAEIGASIWCRKLFVLSRFHLRFVAERGFPREKVIINANAVDTEKFAAGWCEKRDERTFKRIIAVHRFVEKKGLSLLIQAAKLIEDLDVKIEIFGYGELEGNYRRLVRELDLTNVMIHGPVSQEQVIEQMREADLFACPSIRSTDGDMDGIPTSLVESMAAGLPVLATNISGISDLVCDEVTGIIAEPTPEGIAQAIRRFYDLPPLKLRAIIAAAKARAETQHNAKHLVDVLMRVWQNQTVDILIVSWNNLSELKMVVERIFANTALPYHLIICDNMSCVEPVQEFLLDVWGKRDNVTIVFNDRNAMVGPGTNVALEQGKSDCAIYICGKEGISFANGWEMSFIRALDMQPDVGLVGTIGYSPTYLTGEQYPSGIPLFGKFRNRGFAAEQAHRIFGHVQGGLFALRRKMYEEIGGFSEDVPHDYTDVEYSYYAESRGWKLSEAPAVLALFNKEQTDPFAALR